MASWDGSKNKHWAQTSEILQGSQEQRTCTISNLHGMSAEPFTLGVEDGHFWQEYTTFRIRRRKQAGSSNEAGGGFKFKLETRRERKRVYVISLKGLPNLGRHVLIW